jgi:AcrR family transcriptional regulator
MCRLGAEYSWLKGGGVLKTIKQMADELGLNKQKVYRYIKRNHISEAHQEAGVMWYDETVETLIKSAFSENTASSEAHQTASRLHQTISHDAVVEAVEKLIKSAFYENTASSEAHQTASRLHQTTSHDAVVEAVETPIKSAFSKNTVSSEAHQTASSDAVLDVVIDLLKNELEVKNKQISELTETNKDLTAALVAAQQTAAAAQALHAGTMQTQLLAEGERNGVVTHQPEPGDEVGAKMGVWGRLSRFLFRGGKGSL